MCIRDSLPEHQKNPLIVRTTAYILSGQVSTAPCILTAACIAAACIAAAYTLDQNSTAVSFRGGLGASAPAAFILSGQLSTAASSTSKDNPASVRGAAYILSGQVPTTDKNQENKQC